MKKPDSTILDYTKHIEEVRFIGVSERCAEIAREYESFNVRNGIYEKFGEWLLNEARDKYRASFCVPDLDEILQEKNVNQPEKYDIELKLDDISKCQMLREIWPYESSRRETHESDYAYYTLWQIAKAYNCKHGCVVTRSPMSDYGESPSIEIDWSQDALDCITHEKWREEAEDRAQGAVFIGIVGVFAWIVAWSIWAIVEFFSSAGLLVLFRL